jgi:hypothetical protein
MGVEDIDFCLMKRVITGDKVIPRLLMIEHKSYNAVASKEQLQMIRDINKIVKAGCEVTGTEYWGYPIITFDKANPYDSSLGFASLDGKTIPITRKKLRRYLSLDEKII